MIVESVTKGVLVLHRQMGGDPWTARALLADDVMALPKLGVAVPVAEFYENVAVGEPGAGGL